MGGREEERWKEERGLTIALTEEFTLGKSVSNQYWPMNCAINSGSGVGGGGGGDGVLRWGGVLIRGLHNKTLSLQCGREGLCCTHGVGCLTTFGATSFCIVFMGAMRFLRGGGVGERGGVGVGDRTEMADSAVKAACSRPISSLSTSSSSSSS